MNSAVAPSELLHFTERGSGSPLLLVHGLMVTGEMFEPVMEHFAVRHRVIVPDLRGHGRSRGLPPPYTAAQLAFDLARLLDHLGVASAAVLGYSQGGAIAQQLALDHPTRCSRLVLACTFAFNMATLSERLEGRLTPLLAVQFRRYDQAKAWLEQALAYMSERDLDSYRVYLLGWLARLYFETGRWQEAEREATEAIRLHQGESVIPIPALIVLGHLKARRGDVDASEWLEQARSLAMPTGELQRIGPLAAACAEAAWWCGEMDRVDEEALPGYELALQSYNPWTLGQLAYWLWRAGKAEVPLERLADPYRWMIRGEWQRAAQAWARLNCSFEQALALSDGDAPAQIEALAVFDRLGAQPAVKALKARLRDEGVKGVPRGPRPVTRQNAAGLTSREMEVLRLLAEGRSNAAIASQLSISKKTADHHVSALLGKLAAATRSEALAIARRQGLLP